MKIMYMKKGISILMAILFLGTGFAQDSKAKEILDKVSSKTNAYKSIAISFKMTISGQGDPITESGKAYLKGDKYKIELHDQDIYCDGTTITTHLKEDAECYTGSVADSEEDGMLSPNKLLTVWEEGYKYKYIKETTFKGIAVHHINIFPKDPAKSKFHTIILKIDKEKLEVVSVFVKGKDGMNMKYILTKFEKNVEISDSKFVFDRLKHPDVECYDE